MHIAQDLRPRLVGRSLCPPRSLEDTASQSVVFFSRISREKNLALLLVALRDVSVPIDVAIAGPVDDEKYWLECQRLIDSLPAHVRVHVDEVIAPDEVIDYLATFDLFVLPQLRRELRSRRRRVAAGGNSRRGRERHSMAGIGGRRRWLAVQSAVCGRARHDHRSLLRPRGARSHSDDRGRAAIGPCEGDVGDGDPPEQGDVDDGDVDGAEWESAVNLRSAGRRRCCC